MGKTLNTLTLILMFLRFRKFYHFVTSDDYGKILFEATYRVPLWWSPAKAHRKIKEDVNQYVEDEDKIFLTTFERVF